MFAFQRYANAKFNGILIFAVSKYFIRRILQKMPNFPRVNWHITYIISHYNPSVRVIDLVSRIIYIVCDNFIDRWRDLQFKVDSERQIFWETFHGNFIYSEFLPEIAEEILFVFYFDVWPGTRTLALRPTNLLPTRLRQVRSWRFSLLKIGKLEIHSRYCWNI